MFVVGLVFFRREVFEVAFEPASLDSEGFVFDLGGEVGGDAGEGGWCDGGDRWR